MLLADPFVNDLCNLPEAFCVTAALPRLEAARDEEEAVDHLVQKRRYEKSAVVLGILEDGRREHNEGLVAAKSGAPPQGRGADNVALVLRAGLVAPVPPDTLGEAVCEEELVGGAEYAAQGVVIQREVGTPRLGVD